METISPYNCSFLSVDQIKVLATNDITRLVDFLKVPSDVVCSMLEISDLEYATMRASALKYVQPEPTNLLQLVTSPRVIPMLTGMTSFDKMLGGGIYPGDIIELFGKTGTGKTLLSLYLVSRFCHDKEDRHVFYLDMKNDFNAKRLHTFCNESVESLSKVQVIRAPNLEALLSHLDDIKAQVAGGVNAFYSKVRFIVLDSVPMVIYPAVQNDPYSWRYHLEKLIEKLAWFSTQMNIAIVLINHAVTTRPDLSSRGSSASSSQPTIKAALGKYWFHKINIRIHLTKSSTHSNRFEGNLEKSARNSEGQKFKFYIDDDNLLREVSTTCI